MQLPLHAIANGAAVDRNPFFENSDGEGSFVFYGPGISVCLYVHPILRVFSSSLRLPYDQV